MNVNSSKMGTEQNLPLECFYPFLMADAANGKENWIERQENEFAVLESIYFGWKIEDLRKTQAWKIKRPTEFQISLKPQESSFSKDVYVEVDLYVKCSPSYPDVIPELELKNAVGISSTLVATLKEELFALARRLAGEEMLLQLCQHIQAFLHDHNNPPVQSCYEEMVKNQQRREEKEELERRRQLEEQRLKEEKEAKQYEEELRRKQEALKELERKKREQNKLLHPERKRLSSTSGEVPSGSRNQTRKSLSPDKHRAKVLAEESSFERKRSTSESVSGYNIPVSRSKATSLSKKISTKLEFRSKETRKVILGKCLEETSVRGSRVYIGLDPDTGDMLAVKEWEIRWSSLTVAGRKNASDQDPLLAKCKGQVPNIEHELMTYLDLSHNNLVQYLGFSSQIQPGKVDVYVLYEYVGGGSLRGYIERGQTLPLEQIHFYTCQLLNALAYLHSKSIIHKDLRLSSLLLDNHRQLKVADFSINRRLCDLVNEVNHHPDYDKSVVQGQGHTTKKKDVYQVGLMLLSLANGYSITEMPANIDQMMIPLNLKDFIKKCTLLDDRFRWSVHQLLDHAFIKTPIYSTISSQTSRQHFGLASALSIQDVERRDQVEDDFDLSSIQSQNTGSRIQNDFEELEQIGKGGFGAVIKVRNKLDRRFYAIKRIQLNSKKRMLTRKITREVKLLSRLNHENVVRYFNSWIETGEMPIPLDTSNDGDSHRSSNGSDSSNFTLDENASSRSPNSAQSLANTPKNDIFVDKKLDKFVPNVVAMEDLTEWSVCSPDSYESSTDESDSDDDDDDVVVTSEGKTPGSKDSDDSVIFEGGDGGGENIENSGSFGKRRSPSKTKERPKLQFLYIQMEFCDKSTLRDCIDCGLYQDKERVWRLFREIIEGLVHIHDQGMIHRDLKPVNIFLDSNNHVKIGDFGLATVLAEATQQGYKNPDVSLLEDGKPESSSDHEDNLTGTVGTALYVSPEMIRKEKSYNQKVDIYSLGIIFFEMCYPALQTGMERVKVLSAVRLPSINLPDDFDQIVEPNQKHVVCWLLNHDPSKRPTAKELLMSDHLPVQQMEESELNEAICSAVNNPLGRLHKHLFNTIFSQPTLPSVEFSYGTDLYKGLAHKNSNEPRRMVMDQGLILRTVVESLERIFHLHGAIKVAVPLLMPKCQLYQGNDLYVTMMNCHGTLVSLPYDSRVPFARFVAKRNISDLKRYSIDKVFRENRVPELHPKELWECTFDIISSSEMSSLCDAEVVHVIQEIINEFPVLAERDHHLRLNHTSLMKAVMLHCEIPESLHDDVYSIISKVEGQKKVHVVTRLCNLSLSQQCVDKFFGFIQREGSFGTEVSYLRCITKTKGNAAVLAKQGLHDLDKFISLIEAAGCRMQTVLALGLVNNIQCYSGTIFQVVRSIKKKRDVLAVGGVYDHLLLKFRPLGKVPDREQHGVGVSISFDKLIEAAEIHASNQEVKSASVPPCLVDVLVCSADPSLDMKQKLKAIHEIWNNNISAMLYNGMSQDVDKIKEYCRSNRIPHLLEIRTALMETNESSVLLNLTKVERTSDKDRTLLKDLTISKFIEHFQQKSQPAKPTIKETPEIPANQKMSKKSETNIAQTIPKKIPFQTQNSVEQSGNMASDTSSNAAPSCDIRFVGSTGNNMKTSKVNANIAPILRLFNSKCQIKVLAVEMTKHLMKYFGQIDMKDEGTFNTGMNSIFKDNPRDKKYLQKLSDEIYGLKFKGNRDLIIILYSLIEENSYKVLL